MTFSPRVIVTLVLLSVIISCQVNTRNVHEKDSYMTKADTSSINGFISSSAAGISKDTARKFIRTADMKFRVKNVLDATYKIEDITKHFNGFVTFTNLNNNTDSRNVTPISADSSLETTYYTVQNSVTLRVSNTKLDSTLKTIAGLIDYLDYRTIKASDVGLQLLANRLTQQRVGRHVGQLTNAVDKKGKKLGEITAADDNILNEEQQADEAKISSLNIMDQVNFSTINLSIYQRQAIKREVIANYKNINAYQPGMGSRLKDAFKSGWDVMEDFIIMVAQAWWLLLFVVGLYFVYKGVKRRMTKP